ncbi:hypothetical protein HOK00_06225 [bacterium]|nr:hypothetical protein [bacterium]
MRNIDEDIIITDYERVLLSKLSSIKSKSTLYDIINKLRCPSCPEINKQETIEELHFIISKMIKKNLQNKLIFSKKVFD